MQQARDLATERNLANPLVLSVLGIALIDSGMADGAHDLLEKAMMHFDDDLQCLLEAGSPVKPTACRPQYIRYMQGRTVWKRIEAMLLNKIPTDDKQYAELLPQAFAHNPGGYLAAEFAIDVIADERFDQTAKTLAFSVVQREPTGTAAMALVRLEQLFPGRLSLPKSIAEYFKLAADKSLSGQYGSYALEYGLYLLGMPLTHPIADKFDLRFAVRPRLYNTYNETRSPCISLADPWCYRYSINDPRPVRAVSWNKLWTVWRQYSDIAWQFYLNCFAESETEYGDNTCDSGQPYTPLGCLQNADFIENPDIASGKRYIQQALKMSQSNKPYTFFAAMHEALPRIPSANATLMAENWSRELDARLAAESFFSDIYGYSRIHPDDEDKPAFDARMKRAHEAIISITK